MKKQTQIIKTDIDWTEIKNTCRTTVNKEYTENAPKDKFKEDLLISEHSPIRSMKIKWHWNAIKSWVATHFSRHHIGIEKWIGTQRSDRTNVNRDESPQGTEVMMSMEANPQSIINMGRVRLCYQASKETREYMEDLKYTIHEEVDEHIANVSVPNCVYRGGCSEFPNTNCGFWDNFVKRHPDVNMLDIRERYKAYNEDFYNRMEKRYKED